VPELFHLVVGRRWISFGEIQELVRIELRLVDELQQKAKDSENQSGAKEDS